ncbi:hypothetical protein [Hymenobacter terricola]|uniref:hypothetical protein n=1 Tax=Hymenobacter terricola TaxID=2819236 RepID=UPI001B30199C|nr:hypothetical protein [Hymenobacter terricola]
MENNPQAPQPDPQPAPDLAGEAHEGTPGYGDFGHTAAQVPPASQAIANDGSNDNPDEFSEARNAQKAPAEQPSQVEQNQDTAAIRAAQGGTEAEERAAYAKDDPRYAGGDIYDLKNEQTEL